LQFTGLDVGFLFEDVPELSIMDKFLDVAPYTDPQWTFSYFGTPNSNAERFTAKVNHQGRDMDVLIVKFKPEDDLDRYKESTDRLNTIYKERTGYSGNPHYIDFFDSGVSEGCVYEARSVHPQYKTLRQWLEDERLIESPFATRKPFSEIESQLRKVILHMFEFGQRNAWEYVTHGPTIDQFIINPITGKLMLHIFIKRKK